MELAPIALFCYNRPKHTKQVLDALAANDKAIDSLLYIFCDGPKSGAPNEIIHNISKVKALLNNETGLKKLL